MDADITIIGLGPAGLQAAIHAARKKVKVVAVGKSENSPLNKAEIENYLGISLISGTEILRIGREQAKGFGAELLEEEVIKLTKQGDFFITITDHAREIRSKAVILAMGISRAKLNIPGEKDYLGKGVSYCASCDAPFFKGRKVAVIGEASEAAESAHLLSEYAEKVHWIAPEIKTSEHMLEKVKKAKVEVIVHSKPVKIIGEKTVVGLELQDGTRLDVHGVFIALGAKGSIELALELGIMPDPSGKINVDAEMKTEMDHVYACGDVTGTPWQLARAVGQGCVAGDNAAKAVRAEM
jgi:thioredoxin reductase (NADPH)